MNVYRVTCKSLDGRSDSVVIARSVAEALTAVIGQQLEDDSTDTPIDFERGNFSVNLVTELDGFHQIVPISFRPSRRRRLFDESLAEGLHRTARGDDHATEPPNGDGLSTWWPLAAALCK